MLSKTIPVWVSAWVRRDFNARLRNKKHLTKIQSGSKSVQVVGQQITRQLSKTPDFMRNQVFCGANDVTRTHDLLITNQLLYRLSYISILTCLKPEL